MNAGEGEDCDEACPDWLPIAHAPPNGLGIELPAARDLTTVQPTAARPCPLPMRAADGWGAPAHPGAAAGQLQCLVRRRPPERYRSSVEPADAAATPRAEPAARPGWAPASTPGVASAARRADSDRYPRRRR